MHPDHTSNYFKRKLKEKKNKIAKQAEGSQIKVVPKHSDPEITFDSDEEGAEAECC